jgi:uncharacterized membrane protein
MMLKNVAAYFAAAVVFMVLDAGWLTVMGARLYKPALGDLMLDKPSLAPAALFYLIYLFGVVYFCVLPAQTSGRWSTAAVNAVVFGLCAYATYDLTNQATLRIWSVRVTVADLVWGMIVTTSAASASFFLTRGLFQSRGG